MHSCNLKRVPSQQISLVLSTNSFTTAAGACLAKKVAFYAGEEAKVVIISLVRCNSEGKAGFLSTTNRINVLLSRAQHGMYLIGNAGAQPLCCQNQAHVR
jgi:superfamily I DNA and/or RNA helicase